MKETIKTGQEWLYWLDRITKVEPLQPGQEGYINDKWTYAAKKNLDKVSKVMSKSQEMVKAKVTDFVEECIVDYASTDPKTGELLSGNFKGYSFKPENLKEFNQKTRDFERKAMEDFMNTDVSIELFSITDTNIEKIKRWDKFTLEYFSDILPSEYLAEELAESMNLQLVK